MSRSDVTAAAGGVEAGAAGAGLIALLAGTGAETSLPAT